MVDSSWWGCTPRPTESAPCGSKSTSSTWRPYSASAAPRLIVDVVLPTPPFWFATAITRAGPCSVNGAGSGIQAASPHGNGRVGRLLLGRAAQGGGDGPRACPCGAPVCRGRPVQGRCGQSKSTPTTTGNAPRRGAAVEFHGR